VYRLHASRLQREAPEAVRKHQRGGVSTVLLSSNVVPRVYGEVVCQSTGPDSARHLARFAFAVSDLPSDLLYTRRLQDSMTTICST